MTGVESLTWVFIAVHILIGGYDVILLKYPTLLSKYAISKWIFRKTGGLAISQWMESLMPRGVDVAVVAALFVVAWWKGEWITVNLITGTAPNYVAHALFWTIDVGHFLLGHERY